MSPATVYQPHDIYAMIPYWLERRDGSVPLTNEDALKIMRVGEEVDLRRMLIHDIHGAESEYTLDKNGFQVLNLVEEPKYTKDDAEIEALQYPVVVEEIRKLTRATHIKILGHVLRDTLDLVPNAEKLNPAAYGANRPRAPATRPHFDYNMETCPDFFSRCISSAWAEHESSCSSPSSTSSNDNKKESSKKGNECFNRRWQILGVWRPLKTVQRHPLALVDARSVRDHDLVKIPKEYGDRKGAMSILKPGEDHRWCYLYGQRPDEAWVFKHFDSFGGGDERKGKKTFARQCGHAALRLPGTLDLPLRESVEFRVLVLY